MNIVNWFMYVLSLRNEEINPSAREKVQVKSRDADGFDFQFDTCTYRRNRHLRR